MPTGGMTHLALQIRFKYGPLPTHGGYWRFPEMGVPQVSSIYESDFPWNQLKSTIHSSPPHWIRNISRHLLGRLVALLGLFGRRGAMESYGFKGHFKNGLVRRWKTSQWSLDSKCPHNLFAVSMVQALFFCGQSILRYQLWMIDQVLRGIARDWTRMPMSTVDSGPPFLFPSASFCLAGTQEIRCRPPRLLTSFHIYLGSNHHQVSENKQLYSCRGLLSRSQACSQWILMSFKPTTNLSETSV